MAESPNLSGQRIGTYEIVSPLGKGGMAEVYRARQLLPGGVSREVALKLIDSRLSLLPEFNARFNREAQTLVSLSHAHILKAFDYGLYQDSAYLVMELMAGGSLAELVRKGPLPYSQVVKYIDQIGGALDYAHKRGIVHRDLKPQNVLLDESGDAFLTDFGIVKLLDESTNLTQSHSVIGTPTYMSPEQGSGVSVDSRSDLYSLGVILFELLSGQVPFTADTPIKVLFKHAYEPPPRVTVLRPDAPAALDQVIARALAKSPDDRYQKAEALTVDVRAALSHQAVSAPQIAARTQPQPPAEAATEILSAPSEAPISTVPPSAPLRKLLTPPAAGSAVALSPGRFIVFVVLGVVSVLLVIGAVLLLVGGIVFLTKPPKPTLTPFIQMALVPTEPPPTALAIVPTVPAVTIVPTSVPTQAETQAPIPPTPPPTDLAVAQTIPAVTIVPTSVPATQPETQAPANTAVPPPPATAKAPTVVLTATLNANLTLRAATDTQQAQINQTATTTLWTATPTITPTANLAVLMAGTERTDSFGIKQVYVPAGCFMMGSDPSKDSQARSEEQPQHQVCITKAYWLDEFDVTNAAFDAFVKAGGYTNDSLWSTDGLSWKQANKVTGPSTIDSGNNDCTKYSSQPNQPRVCVSYYEAEAYAKWRGGSLPTEAEWEYAARGTTGSIYPWGDTFDKSKANTHTQEGGPGKTTAVDAYPSGKSWVGAYDMAGNVWQWVADWYDSGYYSTGPTNDPTGPSSGKYRGLRGGSFYLLNVVRSAFRYFYGPDFRLSNLGFRLAVVAVPG